MLSGFRVGQEALKTHTNAIIFKEATYYRVVGFNGRSGIKNMGENPYDVGRRV
jgi:hypothetical protein